METTQRQIWVVTCIRVNPTNGLGWVTLGPIVGTKVTQDDLSVEALSIAAWLVSLYKKLLLKGFAIIIPLSTSTSSSSSSSSSTTTTISSAAFNIRTRSQYVHDLCCLWSNRQNTSAIVHSCRFSVPDAVYNHFSNSNFTEQNTQETFGDFGRQLERMSLHDYVKLRKEIVIIHLLGASLLFHLAFPACLWHAEGL